MFSTVVTDVFFDLDHTLWDFEKNSALTFKKILTENDVKVDQSQFMQVYVPVNLEFWKLYREEKITKDELRYQRLKKVFDQLGYDIADEQIMHLAEEYIAHLSSFTHLFPNTIEILQYLRPKYNLHIITNGFQEIQDRKLSNTGIYDYFQIIMNSEIVGVKKPNPLIFNKAIEKAGTSSQKSIMIGDSLEADIFGAQGVGMHTLHFNAHSEPAHNYCHIIKCLSEIKLFL